MRRRQLPIATAMESSTAGNSGDLLGDTTGGAGTWACEEVDPAGRNCDRAPHEKKFTSRSTLDKCEVNYVKPLEMAYF